MGPHGVLTAFPQGMPGLFCEGRRIPIFAVFRSPLWCRTVAPMPSEVGFLLRYTVNIVSCTYYRTDMQCCDHAESLFDPALGEDLLKQIETATRRGYSADREFSQEETSVSGYMKASASAKYFSVKLACLCSFTSARSLFEVVFTP